MINTINLVIRKELNAKLDALEDEFNLLDEKYKNALRVVMAARGILLDLDHMLPKALLSREDKERITKFLKDSGEVIK